MGQTAISIENLWKRYRLGLVGSGTLKDDLKSFWYRARGKEDLTKNIDVDNKENVDTKKSHVWVLEDLNIQVNQGDILGIIGKNGAGKSTLLKILSRVTGPTKGNINLRGRVASLLEVGTGMHPELTGRENIYLNGAILGMTRSEIRSKFDEIVDFAGVAKFIDTPVKRYSSGMRVKLGFAVAAFLEPEVLIVDEVLAVGDAEFQKKAIGKMKKVSQGEGRTILFVSHNMESVGNLCNRGIVLHHGKKVFDGSQTGAINEYISKNADLTDIKQFNLREDRKGTGELRFTNYKLTDLDNNEITHVSTGDSFKIKLQYKVENPDAEHLKNINLSVILSDMRDNIITNNHTALYDKLFSFENLKSKNGFEIIVRDLPLYAQSYIINFSMIQGFTYVDTTEAGFRFEVRNGLFKGQQLQNRPEDGTVIFDMGWNLS